MFPGTVPSQGEGRHAVEACGQLMADYFPRAEVVLTREVCAWEEGGVMAVLDDVTGPCWEAG